MKIGGKTERGVSGLYLRDSVFNQNDHLLILFYKIRKILIRYTIYPHLFYNINQCTSYLNIGNIKVLIIFFEKIT